MKSYKNDPIGFAAHGFMTQVLDNPMMFAQFGLDREVSEWIEIDWSKPVVHLGPGEKHIPGTIELEWPEWDFDNLDLNSTYASDYETRTGSGGRFPFSDNECGGVIATHVLEHLRHPVKLLREVSRILAIDCPFNILVPHGKSLMFLQDLDHKTPFVIETWKTLLSNPYYTKDKGGMNLRLGANFLFGVKEDNLALVTQLIKK